MRNLHLFSNRPLYPETNVPDSGPEEERDDDEGAEERPDHRGLVAVSVGGGRGRREGTAA